MKDNQLKWGTVLSYAQMVINVLIGLLYTPLKIQSLGQSEYGLYSTVNSAISMLSILNFGFSNSYIRYYSRYAIQNDKKRINALNGVFLVLFLAIGLIALIIGIFFAYNLEYLFDNGLTEAEYEIARDLTILFSVNLFVTFNMITFTNIIHAHEQYVFLKIMEIFKVVSCPLITLPLLMMGYRSVAMVTVMLIVSVVMDIIYFWYAKNKLKVTFSFRGFERGIYRHILVYSSFIAINILVDQLNGNMDKLLLGRFVGTAEVAVYSVGYTLYHYYKYFSVGVSSIFIPKIHKIVNSTPLDSIDQKNRLTEIFVVVGRIQFFVLALVASGFVLFGRQFVVMWTDSGYVNAYYVALFLMLSATVPFIQNVGIEIQRALNRHAFASICYLFMAVFNLCISICLCQKYGAVGGAAGTAISFILADGVIMNIYYHKRCNVDILRFWKSIFRMMVGLVLPVAVGCIAVKLLNFYQPTFFLTGVLCYTLIYCLSMWEFGLDNTEKNMIRSIIKKNVEKARSHMT